MVKKKKKKKNKKKNKRTYYFCVTGEIIDTFEEYIEASSIKKAEEIAKGRADGFLDNIITEKISQEEYVDYS